jgi:hypothetical protein
VGVRIGTAGLTFEAGNLYITDVTPEKHRDCHDPARELLAAAAVKNTGSSYPNSVAVDSEPHLCGRVTDRGRLSTAKEFLVPD